MGREGLLMIGIKVTAGHLTAVNKRDIRHMIEHGMTNGKTRAGITYAITEGDDGELHVRSTRVERDDWGRPIERAHRATFTTRELARQ
jgi:hypothetical protein